MNDVMSTADDSHTSDRNAQTATPCVTAPSDRRMVQEYKTYKRKLSKADGHRGNHHRQHVNGHTSVASLLGGRCMCDGRWQGCKSLVGRDSGH